VFPALLPDKPALREPCLRSVSVLAQRSITLHASIIGSLEQSHGSQAISRPAITPEQIEIQRTDKHASWSNMTEV
jgi:hypothetical protein